MAQASMCSLALGGCAFRLGALRRDVLDPTL